MINTIYTNLYHQNSNKDRLFENDKHKHEELKEYCIITNFSNNITWIDETTIHVLFSTHCANCPAEDETIIHVLRDCSIARFLWRPLLPLEHAN